MKSNVLKYLDIWSNVLFGESYSEYRIQMVYEVHLLDRICTFCLLHIPFMALIKSYCTKFLNLLFFHISCCNISLFTSLLISPKYKLAFKLKVFNMVLIKRLTTE